MSRTLAAIYVCPAPCFGEEHQELAFRFAASWVQYPPDYECGLYVVSNGGPPSARTRVMFEDIPEFKEFVIGTCVAKDISAFQEGTAGLGHEVGLFFGGNAYLKRRGWLARMMQAYDFHGPHLYGAFATNHPVPHIRTTGFWLPMELWRRYPHKIEGDQDRYSFEHREKSITQWVQTQGRRPIMVTWSGEWNVDNWGLVPGGYGHVGPNLKFCSECLIGDRISDMMGGA